MPDIGQRLYHLNGGLNDSLPAYGIGPRQVARCDNMRVWNGELRTAKGFVSSTSSLMGNDIGAVGVSTVRMLAYAIREDGTEDLLAASADDTYAQGGYWKLVGDTKTLLSVMTGRGVATVLTAAAYSAKTVEGDSDTRFTIDYAVGDLFWLTADGVASASQVSTIATVSSMTLTQAYGGGASAGGHTGWHSQTLERTRAKFWNNRWFFVNAADPLMEWDGTTFRKTGLDPPPYDAASASNLTATSAAGGSLSASSYYYYTYVWQDARGRYSGTPGLGGTWEQPPIAAEVLTTTANKTAQLTWAGALDSQLLYGLSGSETIPPQSVVSARLYRSNPLSAQAADTREVTFYYLDTVAVSASAYTDDGSVSASLFQTAPAYNFPPEAGYEDLAVIDNRLAAISGRKLYISGLPPTDPNTDTAGRVEPEFWGITHRIGDGEEQGGYGFLQLRGQTFILGSQHLHRVAVRGDDPAVWGVTRFMPNVGCVSKWSIASAGDVAYWLARLNGRITVVAFDGVNLRDIGPPIQGSLAALDTASAVAGGVGHGFYWLKAYFPGAGAHVTLEFNTNAGVDEQGRRLQTWAKHYGGYEVQEFAQAGSEVYASIAGLVYKLESGYSFAGNAVTYGWEIAAVDLGVPEWRKHFHSLQSEFDVYAGSPSVSAKYVLDEGTATALPNSPVAISANPEYRVGFPDAVNGQRVGIEYSATGTDLDFAHRGTVIKGEPDPQDKD